MTKKENKEYKGEYVKLENFYIGNDEIKIENEAPGMGNKERLDFVESIRGNVIAPQIAQKQQVAPSSGSFTPNVANGGDISVVLTGNLVLNNPTNSIEGAIYRVCIQQDGTGGHTMSFGSNYVFRTYSLPDIDLLPNAYTILEFYSKGGKFVIMNDFLPFQQTLAGGANIGWNIQQGTEATVTMTQNAQLDNLTNARPGNYHLVVKQDGTGLWVMTFDTMYKFPGGTIPVITPAPGSIDIFDIYFDGTSAYVNFTQDYQ